MATKIWKSGNWNTAANWNPTGIPAATDDIAISTTTITTYTFNGTPSFKNLTITGGDYVTIAGSVAVTMSGNFTSTGVVTWNHTGGITLNGSAGTVNTLNAPGIIFNSAMTVDGVNVTFRLNSNITIIDTKSLTLKNGFIDLVTSTFTCGFFIASGGGYGTRGIYFTANTQTSAISLSWSGASKTVIDITTGTGFSYTGQSLIILSGDSTNTRTITVPVQGSNNYPLNFKISGSDTIGLTANAAVGNFDFGDFSGTLKNSMRYVYGNYIQGSIATIQGGGTGAATVFTTNTSQFPGTITKTINFDGNTSPTLYFSQGNYTVIGDNTGVYTNSALTNYGKIFFDGAAQVDIYSAIECLAVSHTKGRVNLYGSYYFYQTASTSTSPAYLLSGSGAQLYLDSNATIDAISQGNSYFVTDFNGTGLFFDPTVPSSFPQISCYMLTYTSSTSAGFTFSGPSNADNRGVYQIELGIDSTTTTDVTIWNMPAGITYRGTGTINVRYGAPAIDNVGTGALVIQNVCPNIGFNFGTSKTVQFGNSIMSSLDLTDFTGFIDLNSAAISLTGDFIGGSYYRFTNTNFTPTWTMLGNTQLSTTGDVVPAVFDSNDFYYPITLNFQSVSEYIIQGTRYESPNPIYLSSGTINIMGSYDYSSPDIIVPSVNLDTSDSTRKLKHDVNGANFYLTAQFGTVWSGAGAKLTIESPFDGSGPGTTVFLNNSNANSTRTINSKFLEENHSFSVVVNSSTDKISVLGSVSFTEFVMLSTGTLDFNDITIYGQIRGTAIDRNSVIRMMGQTFAGASLTNDRPYNGYISGHNNSPINSTVFAGDSTLSKTTYVTVGSDISQNLIINRAELDFDMTTATITKNLTVTTTAVNALDPNTAITMPDDIVVGGDIYLSDSVFVDVYTPYTITLNRNTSTTSTFEVGQRTFYDTKLIFNNTSGTGTLIILDNTNDTVGNYNQFNAKLYPGFLDIVASTSTNSAYVKFQSNRNFMLTTDNTLANITKISSTTSGTQHQLVYYDTSFAFDHYGTKISANTVNTTTYVQDSKVNIDYMIFAGANRNAGNNSGWVFGSLSEVDTSFFYLD
jgi:hypothetical protein